jgi:hypothetical protein
MDKRWLHRMALETYMLYSDGNEPSEDNADARLERMTVICGEQVVKSRIPSESPLIEDVQFEEV